MRSKGATTVALAAILSALTATGVAKADPVTPASGTPSAQPQARSAWSHSGTWDYVLAGAGATSLIAYGLTLQDERPPLRWTSPILFDDAARDALRVPSAELRGQLGNVAWGLWGMQLAFPVLVDVPLALARKDPELASDLFWQDAATLTIAGALDLSVRDLVGRARPETYDCLSRGAGAGCLESPEATRSFPGGHMVNSTAASVLTCTQHLSMHLYGGPGDAVVCATTLASDLTIGVLRVMSDNHWASDQIAGAAIGALVGWGVPYVLHFRRHRCAADDHAVCAGTESRVFVLPVALPEENGFRLGLVGLF